MRSEAETLADLAREIQTVPDGIAEAAAIERLRKFQRDNGLTYQLTTMRTDTGTAVEGASALRAVPLQTTISIYRGRQPVYSLSFVPKDNRNLALLGQ